MSRKSRRNSKKLKYNMKGCSKKNKSKKNSVRNNKIKNMKTTGCPNCGPNCYCGPNCNCNHSCTGTCYLNKQMKKMKKGGASGCGSTACPIAPLSWENMKMTGGCGSCGVMQNGGSCGSCGVMQNGPIVGIGQNGGNGFYKPPTPIPGPFVGSGWSGNVAGSPGVNGIDYDKNYFPNNLYAKGDPQTMMKLNGGKRKKLVRKTYKRRKNGGGLIPQDLVNLGRQAMFNIQSNSNAMNGYPAPTNPAPYKDQFVKYDITSKT